MNKIELIKCYKRRRSIQSIKATAVGKTFLFVKKNERVTVVKIKKNEVFFYYTDCDSRYEAKGELHRHQYYVHIEQFLKRINNERR